MVLRGDGGPVLAFQSVPGHRSPVWGAPEQQFHFDVRVDDLAAADEAVLALGAVPLDDGEATRPGASTRTRPATPSASYGPDPPDRASTPQDRASPPVDQGPIRRA